jgi:hypothetical protein
MIIFRLELSSFLQRICIDNLLAFQAVVFDLVLSASQNNVTRCRAVAGITAIICAGYNTVPNTGGQTLRYSDGNQRPAGKPQKR